MNIPEELSDEAMMEYFQKFAFERNKAMKSCASIGWKECRERAMRIIQRLETERFDLLQQASVGDK